MKTTLTQNPADATLYSVTFEDLSQREFNALKNALTDYRLCSTVGVVVSDSFRDAVHDEQERILNADRMAHSNHPEEPST